MIDILQNVAIAVLAGWVAYLIHTVNIIGKQLVELAENTAKFAKSITGVDHG